MDIEKANIKVYCAKCKSFKWFKNIDKGNCHNINNRVDDWYSENRVVVNNPKFLNSNNDCAWYEEK